MRLRRFRERITSAYVGAHLPGAHDVEEGGHTLGGVFRGGVTADFVCQQCANSAKQGGSGKY